MIEITAGEAINIALLEHVTATDIINLAMDNTNSDNPGTICLELWRLMCQIILNLTPDEITEEQANKISDLIFDFFDIMKLSDVNRITKKVKKFGQTINPIIINEANQDEQRAG